MDITKHITEKGRKSHLQIYIRVVIPDYVKSHIKSWDENSLVFSGRKIFSNI